MALSLLYMVWFVAVPSTISFDARWCTRSAG